MKKARRNSWLKWSVIVVGAFLMAGCKTVAPALPPALQDFGPVYKASNVYRRSPALPAEVRRVALLPLTASVNSDVFDSGIENLEPLIYSELEKTMRFEIVPVSRAQLKQWTGEGSWRTDEALPHDLFYKIAQDTGCDAVLFCQLTRYQPYPPLAIGWKFSLVQNPKDSEIPEEFQAQIVWSVDEVLDGGEPAVATGARLYYMQHLRNDAASSDPAIILGSPVRFGQYTLAELLGTLPVRGGKMK
jgi:hypothetical protein